MARVLAIAVTLCGLSAEKCCPMKDGTPNDVSNMDEYPNLTCDCGPGYDDKNPDAPPDGPAPPYEVTCIKHPMCTHQDGAWNEANTFAPASTCLCTEPKKKLSQVYNSTKLRSKCIPDCELDKEFTFANVHDCICMEGPRQPYIKECNFSDPRSPADDDKCVCKANPDYEPPADDTKKKRGCDDGSGSGVNENSNSVSRVGHEEAFFVGFILTSLVTVVTNTW